MSLKRSFPPVIDENTRVLVLGSLPGDRSLAEQRYYAHPQNQFWRLIGAVIDRDLSALAYPNRLTALLDANVGLWDVIAAANRAGSTDAAIADATVNDLPGLVARLPHLAAIGFNGGKSAAIGARVLGTTFPAIERIALPSSSPLHTIGFNAKQPAWLTLRPYLAQ